MSTELGEDEEQLDGELMGFVYVPAPCPQCGAATEKEAGKICRQTSDQTGEYWCAGEFKGGVSVQPTPESVAAANAAIDAMVEREEDDHRKRAERAARRS